MSHYLNALLKKIYERPNENHQVLSNIDFHKIRYTFVHQIFTHYKQLQDENFAVKLFQLENWYIWNLYQ